ncbi:MAG: hypothetical protein IT362_10080 [Deltaproteobacteria bacterium]|nr:hypothetical protein [Deltaproteobacteria bacterium]
MNNPQFWGWSTGPLSIPFWGWEDAARLKGRFKRAPVVVHASLLPGVAHKLERPCAHSTAARQMKRVCASYSGVAVVSPAKAPGTSIVHSTCRLSNKRPITKTQCHAFVEKVVKEKAATASAQAASPVCVMVGDERGVPNISG